MWKFLTPQFLSVHTSLAAELIKTDESGRGLSPLFVHVTGLGEGAATDSSPLVPLVIDRGPLCLCRCILDSHRPGVA